MNITLAHSPDSDDAFMFYALAKNHIATHPYKFQHILKDIETLNQEAMRETFDISAISLHAYPYISDRYQILPCGGSIGNNYGPIILSKQPLTKGDFLNNFLGVHNPKIIGIPGEKTTAFLTLKLLLSEFNYQILPFDQIIPAILSGKIDAGLIIHEGQLNYKDSGLYKIIDLGSWWKEETGLPLPLGANVIRRKLGQENIQKISQLLQKSIEYSLSKEHLEDALEYSLQFARGLKRNQAKRFIEMYVNRQTVKWDDDCIKAINLLYEKAYKKGLLPKTQVIKFL